MVPSSVEAAFATDTPLWDETYLPNSYVIQNSTLLVGEQGAWLQG